jgi:hypothetical protein
LGISAILLVQKKSGAAPDVSTTLPVSWIRLDFEPGDLGGEPAFHAVRLAEGDTFTELFTVSKFGNRNNFVRAHLSALPEKELSVRIQTLNNLADRAGLTATKALAAVERAVTEARKNGYAGDIRR